MNLFRANPGIPRGQRDISVDVIHPHPEQFSDAERRKHQADFHEHGHRKGKCEGLRPAHVDFSPCPGAANAGNCNDKKKQRQNRGEICVANGKQRVVRRNAKPHPRKGKYRRNPE